MFRYFIPVAAIFVCMNFVCAQVSQQDLQPTPVGGLERLALVYLKTDFTPEQRARLNDVQLELIFFVDSLGVAVLEDVNGIQDPDIIDSLKQRKEIPPFRPRYVDGQFSDGIFFMLLSFPSYGMPGDRYPPQRYGSFALDEVEELEYSGQNFQMTVGGVVNSFAGNPSRYLSPGGGLKMDVLCGFDKWGVGLSLSFYGNRAREYYPIQTTRKLDQAPTTFIVALIGSRDVLKDGNRTVNLQLELGYINQTLSSPIDTYDEDYIELSGFSPGLIANYLLPVSKGRFHNGYHIPSVLTHYVNFHAGVRPTFLNLKEARGVMFEFGISYRFFMNAVHRYRLPE
jgi:hypothetical protein